MLAIIDYGIENNFELTETIKSLNEDFIITNNEKKIINSDKLILPTTNELKKAIKQLHLLNLFSLLRMIKKPMLGISSGLILMCEFAAEEKAACLGIYPLQSENCKSKDDLKIENNFNKIDFLKESKIFNGIHSSSKFYFDRYYKIPISQFTTSTLTINKDCSVSLEKENYFGVQFIPEKSDLAGKKFLENFINL